MKVMDSHLIDAWSRFVHFFSIRAEDELVHSLSTGTLYRTVRHGRSQVGQERQAYTRRSQRFESGQSIRITLELKIGLHEPLPLLKAQLELQHVGGKNQRVFGDLPKICVVATNGSQPGVLELACTPKATELRTSARKELFCESKDRSRIKGGKAVKRNSFYWRIGFAHSGTIPPNKQVATLPVAKFT